MSKLKWLMLYIIILSISAFSGEKSVSKISFNNVFSKLNFTVSIDYSPKALRKLQKNHEKVKVWVIVDQFGKEYMEEEAVADGEITINPGEKAIFHGVPLTNSHYRYKANKKYLLTIMVISARKIYENNILHCYSKSGIIYDIHTIQDKVVAFTCKLNE